MKKYLLCIVLFLIVSSFLYSWDLLNIGNVKSVSIINAAPNGKNYICIQHSDIDTVRNTFDKPNYDGKLYYCTDNLDPVQFALFVALLRDAMKDTSINLHITYFSNTNTIFGDWVFEGVDATENALVSKEIYLLKE